MAGKRWATVCFLSFLTIAAFAQSGLLATDDERSVPFETPIIVDVLHNDALTPAARIEAFSQPLHGTTTLSGGGIRYQPAKGFSGVDHFSYRIGDGTQTATARVTVAVGAEPLPLSHSVLDVGLASVADNLAFQRAALSDFTQWQSGYVALNRRAVPLLGLGGGDDLLPAGGVFASVALQETDRALLGQSTLKGMALGADFAASGRWFLGGALGLSRVTSSTYQTLNTAATDGITTDLSSLLGMVSYQGEPWLMQLQLGQGWHHLESRQATSASGQSRFVYAKADYAATWSGLQFLPGVALGYDWLSQAATSAEPGRSVSRGFGELSLQVDYAVAFEWGVLVPSLSTGYQWDWRADDAPIARLLWPESSHHMQLGLTGLWPAGWAGFITAQQRTGDDYRLQAINAGLRREF